MFANSILAVLTACDLEDLKHGMFKFACLLNIKRFYVVLSKYFIPKIVKPAKCLV